MRLSVILAIGAALLAASLRADYDFAYREPVPRGDGRVGRAEIQALIDTLQRNRAASPAGVVLLRAGIYELDAPLAIAFDGLVLRGEGPGTVLRILGNHEAVVISRRTTSGGADAATRYCVVEHLRIEASDTADHRTDAIQVENVSRCELRDLTIAHVYNGIRLDRGLTDLIEDVTLVDLTGEYGLWLQGEISGESDATRLHAPTLDRILGSLPTVANGALTWLRIGPNAHSVEIHGMRFQGGYRGIEVRAYGDPGAEQSNSKPLFFYAHDVEIRDTRGEGIYFGNARQVLMINTLVSGARSGDGVAFSPAFTGQVAISNLIVRDCGFHGVSIAGGRDYSFLNCSIGDCGMDASIGNADSIAAISVAAGVKNVRVIGGRCYRTAAPGNASRQLYGLRSAGDPVADNLLALGVDGSGLPAGLSPRSWQRDTTTQTSR